MTYLIDTNVLSELRRRDPNPNVVAWLQNRPTRALHISVLTLGEIRKGIAALPKGERRLKLLDWLEGELPLFFADRILPIDIQVAERWGSLLAELRRPVPAVDSLLAATALHYGLRLVTRNEKDFEYPGLELVNPWTTG